MQQQLDRVEKCSVRRARTHEGGNRLLKLFFCKTVSVVGFHLEGDTGSRIKHDTDTDVYIQSATNVPNRPKSMAVS